MKLDIFEKLSSKSLPVPADHSKPCTLIIDLVQDRSEGSAPHDATYPDIKVDPKDAYRLTLRTYVCGNIGKYSIIKVYYSA